MTDFEIPSNPKALTPEWLTQALRSTGTINNATVELFSIEMIGEGQAFTGQIARLRLKYDIDEGGSPKSLISKFPASDPNLRAMWNRYRLYEREIRFYREIAKEIDIRIPRYYYGALNIESGESVLVLEDIIDARVGDNVIGCSFEDAELIFRNLGRFHALWWESPQLEYMMGWIPAFNQGADYIQGLYQQSWGPFIEKFGDQLGDSFLEIGTWLGRNIANIRNRLAEPPRTLIHGDLRLDNLLFSSSENGTSLIVIDWQFIGRGRSISDIAYFLVFCLPPEQRRAMEWDLLNIYHSVLIESGIRGYGFDQFLYDYRLSIVQILQRLVVSVGMLDFTSERGQSLMKAIFERCAAAVDDHSVYELMSK
ncbi:MAG: hypothetical protein C4291_01190 [Candidatus Dadabacteria bacterium]